MFSKTSKNLLVNIFADKNISGAGGGLVPRNMFNLVKTVGPSPTLLWITHPFLKSYSKILGLPNVWSSDHPVCSMFLNSETLG